MHVLLLGGSVLKQDKPATTDKKTRSRGRPKLGKNEPSTFSIILQSALIEFSTHGFEGAKIADVAKRAGVVTPAVNYHFKSKQDLWEQSIDYAFREYHQLFDGIETDLKDLDPLSAFKFIIRRYITIAFDNPERIRIILIEGMRENSRSEWLIKKHILPSHEKLRPYLESLIDNKVIKDYSPILFFSMLGGTVITMINNTQMVGSLYGINSVSKEVIAKQADAIVDIILKGALINND